MNSSKFIINLNVLILDAERINLRIGEFDLTRIEEIHELTVSDVAKSTEGILLAESYYKYMIPAKEIEWSYLVWRPAKPLLENRVVFMHCIIMTA